MYSYTPVNSSGSCNAEMQTEMKTKNTGRKAVCAVMTLLLNTEIRMTMDATKIQSTAIMNRTASIPGRNTGTRNNKTDNTRAGIMEDIQTPMMLPNMIVLLGTGVIRIAAKVFCSLDPAITLVPFNIEA